MNTKEKVGIVLAGGNGTRLFPLTYGISKQLLPVYNKPMIYYPIKTLVDMGITKILIIVASDEQLSIFKKYLSVDWNIEFEYIVQDKANGLAESFILGEKFIGNNDVVLILGDNVFLTNTPITSEPNMIYTYKVIHPESYGVVEISENNTIKNIVEKPKTFVSNDAVVGLYCFSSLAVELSKTLKPSARGELEIVDLIREINKVDPVKIKKLDNIIAWFDCGTHDDLLECSQFVRALKNRANYLF